MRSLESLIRLKKWTVDEKRRALYELEGLAAQLEDDRRQVRAQAEKEEALARENPELALGFGSFALVLKEREKKLDESIATAAEKTTAVRDALNSAFRELKSLESVAAQRAQRSRAKAAKLEQAALDEVGLAVHRRLERQRDTDARSRNATTT